MKIVVCADLNAAAANVRAFSREFSSIEALVKDNELVLNLTTQPPVNAIAAAHICLASPTDASIAGSGLMVDGGWTAQ